MACIDENGNLLEERSENTLGHLQSLVPMAESLLKKACLAVKDISCVAASVGPGSFTGIRIGVSTARAFAQAMGIPCIPVPTLQSFLHNAEGYNGLACPVLDARRSQVYAGAYIWGGGRERVSEVVEGGAYAADEYMLLLKREIACRGISDIMFFGDWTDAHPGAICDWQNSSLPGSVQVEIADESLRFQKASSVAKLALKMFRDGTQTGYEELLPMYMRKAEAERKLEAGTLFSKTL